MAESLEDRCPEPSEQIRRFVKEVGGDWEHARRRLTAAQGDIIRATVALRRPAGGARRGRKQEAAHRRVEGLIQAIAARCREIGKSWDESTARVSLAAGDITAEDLQTVLDNLEPITGTETRPRPR